MYRTDKIAVALTAAWVRNGNGAANQEPKDIADFYRAVCEASDFFPFLQAQRAANRRTPMSLARRYLPLKDGLVFSRKALVPARKSSVDATKPK